jgi:hypothetical protein
MDEVFISEIFTADEVLLMQSETEGITVNVETLDILKKRVMSFELFEEFTRKSIAETIRERRLIFDKANAKTRREIVAEVEREIERFRVWLGEAKNLEPEMAHYYSVSLKSLLFGLPIGEQVAYLFGAILDSQPK